MYECPKDCLSCTNSFSEQGDENGDVLHCMEHDEMIVDEKYYCEDYNQENIMARPKSNNVQINISIPSEWKTELENLARIYSVEEGKTITFLDLMRRGIQEKYQLGEQDNE